MTTVGKNTTAIKEYIAKQSEEDKLGEQLRIVYPESPFMRRKFGVYLINVKRRKAVSLCVFLFRRNDDKI